MIPRKIQYCWFGRNSKPEKVLKCIESWKKFCPGWEIIEWNEDNYDVNKSKFSSDAYKDKKWAFVADYARFDVLNQFGGVYLDTDVELLKPIPEYLMEEEAFSGFEMADRVNPGLVYGTVAGQQCLKEALDYYDNAEFTTDKTVVDVTTEILVRHGLKQDNSEQTIIGVHIMPTEYFGCYNHEIQVYEPTENTISLHHYHASWVPKSRIYKYKVIKVVAKILGKERYLRIKRKIKH